MENFIHLIWLYKRIVNKHIYVLYKYPVIIQDNFQHTTNTNTNLLDRVLLYHIQILFTIDTYIIEYIHR